MRKKLLTVALTTVMTLGSAVNVFAVESPALNNSSSTTNGVETEAEPTISEDTAAKIEDNAKIEGLNDKLVISVATKHNVQTVIKAAETLLKDRNFEVLELDLVSGKTALDKTIKITLPLFESIKNAKFVSVYRLEGTTLKAIATVEVNNGQFTFETNHFSTYVFAEASAPTNTDNDKNNPDTGDTVPFTTACTVAAVAAVAFSAVSLKRKNA